MALKVTTLGGTANISKNGVLRARVHAVDVATKDLVYAWLFEIEVDKPLV